MRRISLLVAFLTLAVLPASAGAAVRYAEPYGNGSVLVCEQNDPCSLTDALTDAQLNAGDEVILAPGTYTVASELRLEKGVLVHGTGAASATVVESNGTLNGFYIGDANAELRDVELHHNSGTFAGIYLNSGTVQRVIVRSNSGHGCQYQGGTLRDSVCVSKFSGGAGLAGLFDGSQDVDLFLRNVTAIGAGASNSYGIAVTADDSSMVSLFGNSVIARGNHKDIYVADFASATATVTLSFSNFATVLKSGNMTSTVSDPNTDANQVAAPVFVDAAAGNYRQAAGSPTIDAGTHDFFSGLSDIDGQARPNGAANDIGADEFYAASAPATPAPAADTTPPSGKISKRPKSRTTKRRAKFKFTSNEAGSTFLCKLDRGKYKACKSSYSKKVKLGKHTLRMIAVDAAGNRDATPAVWRWRVVRR